MGRGGWSFPAILEAFERMERDLELADWTIDGVYVWKLVRWSLFYDLRQRHDLMKTAHPEMQRLKKTKVALVLQFTILFFTRNPFIRRHRNRKRVVVPHYRKREYEGHYVDPISYPAWRPPYNKESVVLDNTTPLNSVSVPGAPAYKVFVGLGLLGGLVVPRRLSHTDRMKIREVENRLRRLVSDESYGIEAHILHVLRTFKATKWLMRTWLEFVSASYLYIVVSYGKEAMIAAAQELRMEVVEFQHGIIGRGHLAYDFKGWDHVPYFPDRLLAFGEKWFSRAHLAPHCKVDPVGYSALEYGVKAAKQNTKRNSKQLLALSQGPFSNEIIEHVAQFAARCPEWRVIVRPHPSENEEEIGRAMARRMERSNWVVDGNADLAVQAAESGVVFGVNSTALIEAMFAGCRLVLLDTRGGGDYFEDLLETGDAVMVSKGEELAAVIDSVPIGDPRGYFAEPVRDVVALVENEGSGG